MQSMKNLFCAENRLKNNFEAKTKSLRVIKCKTMHLLNKQQKQLVVYVTQN